jgi:RNA polymerase sigma-70 factor (ECF subfamily)
MAGSDHACNPERLIAQARQGMPQALGQLLEAYRNYLQMLATSRLGNLLQARVSPSDIVQETFLQANLSFDQFRGASEQEFLAWLRRVLASQLEHLYERHVLAEKRDVRREVSIDEIRIGLERSTARLETVLADRLPSPDSQVQRRELAVLLADELAELPSQYSRVLLLRSMAGLSFKDVAQQMERSEGAVRMLWLRAVQSLRERLTERGLI